MGVTYKHIDSSLLTVDDILDSQNVYSIINIGIISKIELYSFSDLTNNLDNIYNTYSHDDQINYKDAYENDKSTLQSFQSNQQSINKQSQDQRTSSLKSYSDRLQINKIDVGTILYIPDFAVKQENIITQSNQNIQEKTFKEFFVNELRFLELDNNYRQLSEELDGNLGIVKKMFPDQTVWLWSKALSDTNNLEGKIINLSPFIQNLNTGVGEVGGNWSITLPPILADYVDSSWKMMGIQQSSEIVAKSTFQDKKRGENYYFYNVIQANDIIYIRFETLRNEVKQRIKNNQDFEISNSELPNGIYDMIGLVDSISINVNPGSNDVTISVQGRDFIKTLIDDGTYFFATDYIPGGTFVQNQSSDISKEKARNRVEGKLYQLSLASIKSIDFSLKFIINALSNITICNDNVFNGYKNADQIVDYDRLKGQFITKRADITSKRQNIVFQNKDKTQYKTTEQNTSGIWQIIKLIVDQNIQNYRQVDATLGNEMGSILNAINKVCQKPFCEFFGDTYRNQYYFIARRPPTDYNGYKALADVSFTIKSEDVLDYQLNFFEEDTYSWFRLQPQASIDELGVKSVWAYLKAIRFEEYASLYGDKALNIVSNYIHYQSIVGQKEILNINSATRRFILDFKYLIESYQYMPFIRKGYIVTNGDRRLKRGTVVYFEKTKEYCYIDHVAQSYSMSNDKIDRTTTIQVSRCMVKDYLQDYFNIINLPVDDVVYNNVNTNYEEFIEKSMTKWRVNNEKFIFFLKRQQFINNNKHSFTQKNVSKSKLSTQITGKLR